MRVFEWKSSYSVGVEELDAHHRKLLEIINRVLAVGGDRPEASKQLFAVLNELVTYAETHFAAEEGLLRAHGYPGLAQQERDHVMFHAEIFNLLGLLERDPSRASRAIADYVRDWFIAHILGSDQEYKEFLASATGR